MLIRTRDTSAPAASEITPEPIYRDRRRFLRQAGQFAVAGAAAGWLRTVPAGVTDVLDLESAPRRAKFSTDEPLTAEDSVTTYNNFYEFGTGKTDPAQYADALVTEPWSVTVAGACEKPGTYALEDVLRGLAPEERIYRLRCVEGWSMVIPWLGVPLAALLKRYQPTSAARYVAFQTLYDPDQMRGQRRSVLEWPYREGLRMDEAMHPLTIMAVGLYGKPLPNQNGAPLRLVVPWKYGFKSIKSIVRIEFTETEPPTTWNMMAPREYGFYANVNPQVDHPRWSQSRERGIGKLFRQDTLMFNGYGEQVASLYRGLDLRRNY
ncbi:MAG TPA: protein-methionine-sulfoxide reductase catalytic subunit MsrP [Gammaproteobacteria bacterium]|nr:protein-methionine-sulfoxide reductase catalytic subunit MsrP [Gammaproteobacteria bacterium]